MSDWIGVRRMVYMSADVGGALSAPASLQELG